MSDPGWVGTAPWWSLTLPSCPPAPLPLLQQLQLLPGAAGPHPALRLLGAGPRRHLLQRPQFHRQGPQVLPPLQRQRLRQPGEVARAAPAVPAAPTTQGAPTVQAAPTAPTAQGAPAAQGSPTAPNRQLSMHPEPRKHPQCRITHSTHCPAGTRSPVSTHSPGITQSTCTPGSTHHPRGTHNSGSTHSPRSTLSTHCPGSTHGTGSTHSTHRAAARLRARGWGQREHRGWVRVGTGAHVCWHVECTDARTREHT